MCESVENVSIGERERRGERENKRKKKREREKKKEKEGEGEGEHSLFIHISFLSGQGTLHFISVFGHTVMTWQHSSLSLLSHSLSHSLSISSTHTHSHAHYLSFTLSLPSLYV